MQVVIERVETHEQFNFLCGKGYLLSRPLPYNDLTEYPLLNRKGGTLTIVSRSPASAIMLGSMPS